MKINKFYSVFEITPIITDESEVTTISRDFSIKSTEKPTNAVTSENPPIKFFTCNELFLKGQTPRPGVNCIHTVASGKYLNAFMVYSADIL